MATKKRKAKTAPKMDASVDNLYKAVDAYVKARGGSLVVIGGIQIQEWPQDGSMCFVVGVKCLGRKPEFPPKVNK